jgi:HAD superfamily hydrolase (TIGR01549 family)
MAGLTLPSDAKQAYQNRFLSRLSEFHAVNLRNDENAWKEHCMIITRLWLSDLGLRVDLAESLQVIAESELFSAESKTFQPFEGVHQTLSDLKNKGYQLAVISNWDLTLSNVLKAHRLDQYFDLIVASLVEGIEKPYPRLFHIALEKLGVKPSEAVHIGDDPVDDIQGAESAGMAALLFDSNRLYSQLGAF